MQGVNRRGVEQRYLGVGLGDEHGDFRAAEDHCLGTLGGQAADDPAIGVTGLGLDDAQAELLENDAMDSVAVYGTRREHGEAMLGGQTIAVEILFHGEAGADQADRGVARCLDDVGRGVGYMQERDADRGLDGGRHFMHGIRANDDAVGAGEFQGAGRRRQQLPGCMPIAGFLQQLHFVEIQAVEDDFGGVQAAEPLFDELIDLPVIRNRGFPAHAADEADGLHDRGRRGADSVIDAVTIAHLEVKFVSIDDGEDQRVTPGAW